MASPFMFKTILDSHLSRHVIKSGATSSKKRLINPIAMGLSPKKLPQDRHVRGSGHPGKTINCGFPRSRESR